MHASVLATETLVSASANPDLCVEVNNNSGLRNLTCQVADLHQEIPRVKVNAIYGQ